MDQVSALLHFTFYTNTSIRSHTINTYTSHYVGVERSYMVDYIEEGKVDNIGREHSEVTKGKVRYSMARNTIIL